MKRIRPSIIIVCTLLVVVGVVALIVSLSTKTMRKMIVLTPEQIEQVVSSTANNPNITEEQLKLVEACISLVDRVGYFWGGKSSAIGWDDKWGVLTEVTSAGSESTGTMRPYGLDCSGYVSWAFMQLGYSPQYVSKAIGEGTRNQWKKSQAIRWNELQVGDFVFQNEYPKAEGNHIGICIGFWEGEPVFAHCSYGQNNVVVTNAVITNEGAAFRYARRPAIFTEMVQIEDYQVIPAAYTYGVNVLRCA